MLFSFALSKYILAPSPTLKRGGKGSYPRSHQSSHSVSQHTKEMATHDVQGGSSPREITKLSPPRPLSTFAINTNDDVEDVTKTDASPAPEHDSRQKEKVDNVKYTSTSGGALNGEVKHQDWTEQHQQRIDVVNAVTPFNFYANTDHRRIGRKHYETVSIDALVSEIVQRQDVHHTATAIQRAQELASRRAILSQALRTLQAREAVVETTETSSLKLLLLDERIQRKEKEVEQREIQVAAKDLENQKTERELRAREREQQIQFERKVEPLAAREFQIMRKEDDLKTIESALEARVNSHTNRINAEEDAMRARERSLRDNEIKLAEQLESSSKAQAEYQNLHQLWQRKYKQLVLDEEQLNAREKELSSREAQLFAGEKALLNAKQKISVQESELVVQRSELQAATAQLEILRTDLRQKELAHEANVNRLIDAQSELSHNELALDKKVSYSEKIIREAADVFKNAQQSLQKAEEDRKTSAGIKERVEQKLRDVQAREQQLKKIQQGLEKQKVALDAISAALSNREARLADERDEFEKHFAASNSLKPSNFFNHTLSGFSRIGTAASSSLTVQPRDGGYTLLLPPHVNSSSPVSMQQKALQVVELYTKPQSRKLVNALAHRQPVSHTPPPVGRNAPTHLSSTTPSLAQRAASSSVAFSTSTTIMSSRNVSSVPLASSQENVGHFPSRKGPHALLPPINKTQEKANKPHRATKSPASLRSNGEAASFSKEKIFGGNGPSTYDNPFSATGEPAKLSSSATSDPNNADKEGDEAAQMLAAANQLASTPMAKDQREVTNDVPSGFAEVLREVSLFWATEKRCNQLESELDRHLVAMRNGSVLPASSQTVPKQSSDVSWEVEGGQRVISTSRSGGKGYGSGSGFKKQGYTTNVFSAAPSAYRCVPHEVVHECVYVQGAQSDARVEFEYLVQDVLLTAAQAQMHDTARPDIEGEDAFIVYSVATIIHSASSGKQNAHQKNAQDSLSLIILKAFERAQKLLRQRTQWLEGCLSKLKESIAVAEGDNSNNDVDRIEGKDKDNDARNRSQIPNCASVVNRASRTSSSSSSSRSSRTSSLGLKTSHLASGGIEKDGDGNPPETREPSGDRTSSLSSRSSSRSTPSLASVDSSSAAVRSSGNDEEKRAKSKSKSTNGEKSSNAYSSDSFSSASEADSERE